MKPATHDQLRSDTAAWIFVAQNLYAALGQYTVSSLLAVAGMFALQFLRKNATARALHTNGRIVAAVMPYSLNQIETTGPKLNASNLLGLAV